MKKIVFMSIVLVAAFTASQVQAGTAIPILKTPEHFTGKKGGNVISVMSKDQFNEDFGPISKVKWNELAGYDEATFKENGIKTNAYYDYNSQLVGTTTTKTFTDLPVNAQKEIKTKYKGYTVGPVILFDDAEYNATDILQDPNQFEGADNYFVELTKGKQGIVLRVDPVGYTYYFSKF